MWTRIIRKDEEGSSKNQVSLTYAEVRNFNGTLKHGYYADYLNVDDNAEVSKISFMNHRNNTHSIDVYFNKNVDFDYGRRYSKNCQH